MERLEAEAKKRTGIPQNVTEFVAASGGRRSGSGSSSSAKPRTVGLPPPPPALPPPPPSPVQNRSAGTGTGTSAMPAPRSRVPSGSAGFNTPVRSRKVVPGTSATRGGGRPTGSTRFVPLFLLSFFIILNATLSPQFC